MFVAGLLILLVGGIGGSAAICAIFSHCISKSVWGDVKAQS